MKKAKPSKLLRGAIAAVLACGLMLPVSAAADEGDDATPSPAALARPYAPLAAPADATPSSPEARAGVTVGGLQVFGGVNGVDWKLSGNALHVMTSTPLTISNAAGTTTSSTTIVIDAGKKAEITLDNVNISTTSGCPIDLITNLKGTATGKPATEGTQILDQTSLYLKIADGTENRLYTSDGNGAGIHCGEGSDLVIDDERDNRSASGEMAQVKGAKVAEAITLEDGTALAAGDPSSKLDSPNPGKLIVTGGLRAAGIGSTALENGGKMTFNGGNIKVDVQGAYDGEGNSASLSAGIGAGAQGDGTASLITFNGGTIWSHGGVHGSGIGAAHSGCLAGTPRSDIIQTRHTAMQENVAGDININGGFITSVGGVHGGAFGSACWSSNAGRTITVTGGTLIPIAGNGSTGAHTHYKPFPEIGGYGGHVVITGGSVRCTDPKQYFQGVGDTAWGSTDYSKETNKVTMVAIDLSEELRNNNTLAGIDPANLNSLIESWELSVGSEPYTYGAPANFDDGKLYLWLPESATKKQISVTLKYQDAKGGVHEVLPLFREPNQSGTLLRRFLDFEITDKEYLDSLTKYYDGTPLPAYDLSAPGKSITTPPPDNKTLDKVTDAAGNQLIRYYYQPFDKMPDGGTDPKATGAETSETRVDGAGHTVTVLPSNAGAVRLTLVSKQFADETSANEEIREFAKSYWGHRAFMWGQIKPVASVVHDLSAEWSDEDKGSAARPGTSAHPSDRELLVSAVIERAPTVDGNPASEPTKPTCAAPEGRVQLYVDGQAVGGPIELRFEPKKDADGNVILGSDGKPAFPANAVREGDDTAGHRTVFNYAFKPSETDYLVPDVGEEGRHVVSLKFLPPSPEQRETGAPANFSESIDPVENPEEAPEAEVVIEPIDPNPTTSLDKPDGFDPDLPEPVIKTDPDPSPDDPDADPDKPGDKTYEGEMTLYYKGHDEGKPNPGRVELKLDTPSSGPVAVTTADGTIVKAEVKRDEHGNPVRDADGKLVVLLDPEAVGKTELVIKQEPNGAYTGTTFVYDVTVKPDPQIRPKPSVTKTAENVDHPNGPTQPGDRIRYTITASNAAAGSAWNNVVIADPLPTCLELVAGSVRLANPSEGVNGPLTPAASPSVPALGQYLLAAPGADGRRILTVPAGTVGGGKSAVVTFECTVKEGLTGRDAPAASLENVAAATGTRPDPDDPYNPDAPELPENPSPSAPVTPPGGSVVAPDDPAEGDLVSAKTVENLMRPEAKVTRLGDRLRYTVTLENKGPATACLENVVISDPVPEGIVPMPGTFELVDVAGKSISVADGAWNAQTRTLALWVGDLWGHEKVALAFEAEVTEPALFSGAANIARWTGSLPSSTPNPESRPEPEKPGTPAPGPNDEAPRISGSTPTAIPPTVVPDDPAEGDVAVAKEADNTTSDDGKTRVGDVIHYTVRLTNSNPGTGWMDAVIRDDVPRGLEPVSQSIKMTLPGGAELSVPDAAYDDRTRRLSVSAGRVYGGQEVVLSFDALVTEEALGADIGNVAVALGTLPSDWDPDTDGAFPAAGQPFDPPAGWESFDRESEKVQSEAAYPPGTNEKGGVIEGAADDAKTIKKVRLAQTGDALLGAFGLGAALALAALAVLVLARRRARQGR